MKCDAAQPMCTQCDHRGRSEDCEYVIRQDQSTVQILEDIISRLEAPIQGLQVPIVAQDPQPFASTSMQPLPNTLDPFDGSHLECALGSADQNVAQPFVNRSSVEESERNIAPDSQYRNRLPSIDDSADKAENLDSTSTLAQRSIDEILAIVLSRAQELRKKNPHINPIPVSCMAHNTLTPDYRIPWGFATNVHHHHHYYYNAPNVSPPPIINKNIVKINNKNTSLGSDSSESGDDQESTGDEK